MLANGIIISSKSFISSSLVGRYSIEHYLYFHHQQFKSASVANLTEHRIPAQQKADERCLQA
jgi:hypothetical protein